MITVNNSPSNKINWEISVSAPLVVNALKTLGYPVDISAKLHKIGEHALNKDWRRESAALLVSLASRPDSNFSSLMRRNKANVIEIVDKRFAATLDRKLDAKANNFREASFIRNVMEYAQLVVMQSITIDKVGR